MTPQPRKAVSPEPVPAPAPSAGAAPMPNLSIQASAPMSRYVILSAFLLFVIAVTVIGWLGSLRTIDVLMSGRDVGLIAFAVIAGVACFFNPCAIPVFPILVTQIYRSTHAAAARPASTPKLALVGGLGVFVFMALFGLIVLSVGMAGRDALGSLMGSFGFRIVRFVAGLLLVGLGIVLVMGWDTFSVRPNPKWLALEAGRPGVSMFLYGFFYTVLGLGCTAPILGATTVLVVNEGGFARGFTIFAVASIVMALLMVATTFIVRSQRRITGPWLRRVPQVAGALFIVAGLFIVGELLFGAFQKALHPFLP